jgi:copper/silver efflux system protein
LAVLTAFLFMRYLGVTSNIMSLAGIAIAIGVLVDAAIVVTENTFRFITNRGVNPRDRRLVTETVLEATRLVGRPIFFSMAIIILAFVPVFALTGQEGKLFHPLAFTKTFSMVGATLLSVTLVPVLCSLLIGGKIREEEHNPVPVEDGDGKFLQRTVVMGPLIGEAYTVLRGLEPGEAVVTEGSFFLRAESLRNARAS